MTAVIRNAIGLLFATSFLTQPASGQMMLGHMFHGQASGCRVESGSYAVEFLAEPIHSDGQHLPAGHHGHCDHVPEAGPVRLIVDLVDHDMRSMPMGMRLVKITDDGEKTIVTVPPKIYTVGFAAIETTLADEGNYVLHLDLSKTEHRTEGHFSIPVHVGDQNSLAGLLAWVLVALLAAAAGAVGWSPRLRKAALAVLRSGQHEPLRDASKP